MADKHDDAVTVITGQWNKQRVFKTVALYSAFFGQGLACSVLGPTLVSMEILLETDTKSISAAFTGGALGFLSGAILCGFIYSRINKELLFSSASFAIGLSTALAPWSPHLYILVAVIVVQSFGMALLDTAAQPYVLKLWQDHKAKQPILQGLHGILSVGSTVGPFIVKPFLVDVSNFKVMRAPEETHSATSLNTTLWLNGSTVFNSTSLPHASTIDINDEKVRVGFVRWAYAVVASLAIVASILFIILYFISDPSLNDTNLQEKTREEDSNIDSTKSYKIFRIRLFILMFCYFFFYVWIEAIPGSFLASFVVKELTWPNDYGALITAAYWGSHGAGRILGIPISTVMQPQGMLIMDYAITSTGFLILVFVHYHDALMWVGVVLAGLGMGTIFPTTILWLEGHMKITGVASSVFLAASSTGGMVGPVLTGFLFNDHSHMWFIYLLCLASLLLVLIFVSAQTFVRNCVSNTTSKIENMCRKNMQTEELKPLGEEKVEPSSGVGQNPHDSLL